MSDDEEVMAGEGVEGEEEAVPETVNQALKEVLKRSLIHDGLARGLREAVKALDKNEAHLCVLAEDCDNADYRALIQALCEDNSIDLIKVKEGRKKLGEWVGLAEYSQDGKVKNVSGKEKIVGCSCVVVKDFGEQSKALEMLLSKLLG